MAKNALAAWAKSTAGAPFQGLGDFDAAHPRDEQGRFASK